MTLGGVRARGVLKETCIPIPSIIPKWFVCVCLCISLFLSMYVFIYMHTILVKSSDKNAIIKNILEEENLFNTLSL